MIISERQVTDFLINSLFQADSGFEKKIPKKILKKPKHIVKPVDPLLIPEMEITVINTDKKSDTKTRRVPHTDSTKNQISISAITTTPSALNNNKFEAPAITKHQRSEIHIKNKIVSGEITIVPIHSPDTSPSINPNGVVVTGIKRKIEVSSNDSIDSPSRTIKRIKPTTILSKLTLCKADLDSDDISKDSSDTAHDDGHSTNNNDEQTENAQTEAEKTPINEAFSELLAICRQVDSSEDMEKLINKKLIRYYQAVHPDFVNSKSFSKNIRAVIDDIRTHPNLVYLKLTNILEELRTRKKCRQTVLSNEGVTSTGDTRKDHQIRKLNRALYVLKKKIAKLDEEEVDFDAEDNSIFMISERYKKRACEIYEKICDITGESKNAQRLVKKPITFQGTSYTQFNQALQTFVNQTKSFPDMFDVMRCLEHCNLQYDYKLSKDECRKIGE